MSLPFIPGLERFTPTRDAYFYPNNPQQLVKIIPVPRDSIDSLTYAVEARTLLQELPTKYDIDVVPFSLTLANLEKGPGMAAVIDMIEGTCVDYHDSTKDSASPGQHQAAIDLMGKLFGYLQSKAVTGEAILGDIYNTYQYLFDSTDSPTLVDIAPMRLKARDELSGYRRAYGEIVHLDYLLGDCVKISSGDTALRESWAIRGRGVLDAICKANGVAFSRSSANELIKRFMAGNDDEMEEIYLYELDRQENKHLRSPK